ncbi:PspC domain-containing protein [Paenibacillus sp.]|jgi:phage shock protein PspC (stress-responsive transcriptional regulator)|uniref:PspC domain-containing protein n=1 Tax=Paenibacillus sp. TaxID=58172 RepID=UPI00282B93A0|nr:PspC domain-containing protein [Paenibacillus sp.]MDR0266935.1 PspC domain-containing protein [Paenibacillus sp.]
MSKLYRSTRDKVATGLCGGLSEAFGIDSTLLRVLFIVSIFFTGGTTLFIYFIASLVVPKEPLPPYNPYGHGSGGYYGGGRPGNNSYNGGNGGYSGYSGPSYDPRSPYNDPSFGSRPAGGFNSQPSNLDAMMEDIEKKAMKKELEELKKKLSNYEKGEV